MSLGTRRDRHPAAGPAAGSAAGARGLSSPVWLLPYDDFRRQRTSTGFTVELDHWSGTAWAPTGLTAVRTPSRAIAFPQLSRPGWSGGIEPARYRVRFLSASYRSLYPEGGPEHFDATRIGVEFEVPGSGSPPPGRVQPRLVPLLPATAFGYPPGARVVHGVVHSARTGAPVDNCLVQAVGQTVPEGVPWRERTLTDAAGAFRLSLRWAGARPAAGSISSPIGGAAGSPAADPGEEQFELTATQDPEHTGTCTLRLPRDLAGTHVIEIS